MEDKSMPRFKSLLFVLALAGQVPLATTTVTYVVGTCEPSFPRSSIFMHIQDALNAAPAPNVVEVCPGTYNEQVVITKPVTLEGISDGNSTRATIAVPSGGLVVTGTNDQGEPMAAQIFVDNSAGKVNLSNLTVDGTGNGIIAAFFPGVFYQNSSGTINRLTILNHEGDYGGAGVWLDGGGSKPTVTVENSNVEGYDVIGIFAETYPVETSELTVTIKGNYAIPIVEAEYAGIYLFGVQIASVSGNLITGTGDGIDLNEVGGNPVSANTIVSARSGIEIVNDWVPVTVTSNTIFNTIFGIGWNDPSTVTGNTIVAAGDAIDFGCAAGSNVHSNTMLGVASGLINVPTGTITENSYHNVGTISSGGC
jgi:nitrous oxidase accessory protein NosD